MQSFIARLIATSPPTIKG